MRDWWIYRGAGPTGSRLAMLDAERPPWRRFDGVPDPDYRIPSLDEPRFRAARRRGEGYQPADDDVDVVNAAMFLRRPLLVGGKPGVGKSTLAYSIATDLELGPVLHWAVTSKSSLRDGLYQYDAIRRLQDANLHRLTTPTRSRAERSSAGDGAASIGHYITLGPLGTALLPTERPRVLLVDELDKGDIDLAGDLLTVFEEGHFEIPELTRVGKREPSVEVVTHDGGVASVHHGRVQCRAFPIVVLTTNGEREFPPAFLRRCVRLTIEQPAGERLKRILAHRLEVEGLAGMDDLIAQFADHSLTGTVATDQLLSAIELRLRGVWADAQGAQRLREVILKPLSGPDRP
jgi:MoxR-like ATPase